MEELNINIASSYLVMAAELMELKSKSLLPSENNKEELEDDYEENTRENLIKRLIEYQKYKEISNLFKNLESNRKEIYIKEPEPISNYIESSLKESELSSLDLLEAMKKFLERKEEEKPLNTKITSKEYSIKETRNNIRKILTNKGKVDFTELFTIKTKSYIVATFLAILEMSKENEIDIKQEKNFSNIYIELRRT